jgi:hypothetical protein
MWGMGFVFKNETHRVLGASAPNPDLLFALMQKVNKKIKAH